MNDLFADQTFSVSDITSLIKQTLEITFHSVTVEGEISNFRPASSGHWYFQLNDTKAALAAVMFKPKNWRVPFIPQNGDRVRITGNITVYEKRGSYQLLCDSITKTGEGDILALLEQRKREFAAAGYFDSDRKRSLPPFPKRICVVTSPTGAAIRDILQVLNRRNRTIDVVVLPALVQGDEAAKTIAAQIRAANRWKLGDVIIIGRGGGSVEDLLPFSDRLVIEALVESQIPVVSAVGHEIDWALSDYAADVRAPTPSAAAELVSRNLEEITSYFQNSVMYMARTLLDRVALFRSRTALFTPHRMSEYFSRRLQQLHLQNDDLRDRMISLINERLSIMRSTVNTLNGRLRALSPLGVLNRGYAIVIRSSDRTIVTRSDQLVPRDEINIRFAYGSATATTVSVEESEMMEEDNRI